MEGRRGAILDDLSVHIFFGMSCLLHVQIHTFRLILL